MFRKEDPSSAMNTLSLFNQQVLQCQDDAYTLAWYLLGDEAEAEAVMQKAIEAAYRCFALKLENCHLLILKQVVEQCRGRKPAACGSNGPDIFHNLELLTESERLALILIEVLRLGYSEAARITDIPLKETGRLLAQARLRMIKPIITTEQDGR